MFRRLQYALQIKAAGSDSKLVVNSNTVIKKEWRTVFSYIVNENLLSGQLPDSTIKSKHLFFK